MNDNLMRSIFRVTAFFHGFIGLGAVAGGLGAVTDPDSPMGISTDILKASPFDNFFIPGIVLFGLIGLGNLTALLLYFKKPTLRGYGSGVMGCALVCWILIQCIMLRSVGVLHVIYLLFGVVQGISAVLILYTNRQFPVPLILKILKKLSSPFLKES